MDGGSGFPRVIKPNVLAVEVNGPYHFAAQPVTDFVGRLAMILLKTVLFLPPYSSISRLTSATGQPVPAMETS